MIFATATKTLALLGLMSLTLAAPSSQAEGGFVIYSNNPNANPWLNGPAYQQARFVAAMKERQAQLDLRQDEQLQRIMTGMEDGRLTSREAVSLLREHLAIGAMERRYLADGRLGPRELGDLEQRLAEAERHIVFERSDRDMARDHYDHRPHQGRPDAMERR